MIDAERLIADLRRAADEVDPGWPGPLGPNYDAEYRWRLRCRAWRDAWRFVAAAIEDGEYDDDAPWHYHVRVIR